jgi:AraC family transcriptional activator of pobA
MKLITIEDFYKETAMATQQSVDALLPEGIRKEIGHFNVFSVAELMSKYSSDPGKMIYNPRSYYKVSLIRGKSIAEYADKVIEIETNALLFATPKVPYNWVPQTLDQNGYFCIFTNEFLTQAKSGAVLDELPLFRPGGYPVFQISDKQTDEMVLLFQKMQEEISSNYLYKYDLIRNFLMEMIHFGQKLQPLTTYNQSHNASARVSALFIELLERQFPIASMEQKLSLRTAKDYADRLSVHSNHLNKVLKERTGKTTTEHITEKLIREAKILLRQTDWNVSEIAYSLGFEQLSHFSNFFKKQTTLSPIEMRSSARE